jgi:predicted hydrocarbon binding protein
MIDGEISLKSLLYVTESLEQLIGKNGAKAVLRVAGQRAAVNLIEMLPLTLPEEEAASRIGPILSELGFLESMEVLAPNTIKVSGNHIYEELAALNLQGTASACYYVIGLFEGFLKQLTGSNKKITMVETKESAEFWKLE